MAYFSSLRRLIYLMMTLTIISAFFIPLLAASYFIRPNGNNENKGLDTICPFKTIQKAARIAKPGDTIFIMNGLYKNFKTYWIVDSICSGTEKAWIVIMAYPGHKPQLYCNGSGGFYISSASYIEINGLEMIGNKDTITLDYANSHSAAPECRGIGIFLSGGNSQTAHPHHIRIINNSISNFCQAGISVVQCDYVTISNNIVCSNAWYGKWAGSGITVYQNWQFDTITEYKMLITKNICYDNRSLVKWVSTGKLSDGNGIIVDDSKNTQHKSPLGKYAGRTLVANNVCYNNGGSGIHSYSSEHVDIVNNTVFKNSQVVNFASCFAYSSNDVRIFNNIIFADTGKNVNDNKGDTNVIYDYNIYFGGLAPAIRGEHDTIIDPKLTNPSIDPEKADFRPMKGSYAIGHGKPFPIIKVDILGNLYLPANGYDIGAYKFQ